MFFRLAVKTKSHRLQQAIYWGQVPLILVIALGGVAAVTHAAKWAVAAVGGAVAEKGFAMVSGPLSNVAAVVLAVYALDQWFRYRAGSLLICTLSRCPEDICVGPIRLRRGRLIVALRMGELYNYLKFWRMRLSPKELVPFVYLETYKGVLSLIERIRSGRVPIEPDTPLMVTTPLAPNVDTTGVVVSPEQIDLSRGLIYRLAMGLALRRNPFSSRIPRPRGVSRRVYFPARWLLDHEAFFRDEVARLSRVTEKILERKRRTHDMSVEHAG